MRDDFLGYPISLESARPPSLKGGTMRRNTVWDCVGSGVAFCGQGEGAGITPGVYLMDRSLAPYLS